MIANQGSHGDNVTYRSGGDEDDQHGYQSTTKSKGGRIAQKETS